MLPFISQNVEVVVMAMLNISQLLSTGKARRVNLYRDGKSRKQFGYKVVDQDKHKKIELVSTG